MDPVESAACVILGVFAVLFSWNGFSRRTPAPTPAPTATTSIAPTQDAHHPAGTLEDDAGEAAAYIHEACQIHARWSGASSTHVACFDLFEIIQADSVSFSGDVDAFAAVMGPALDNPRRDDEKIQAMLLSYEYLCDEGKRAVYTAQLMPLIAEQRQASRLDCSSYVPLPAHLNRSPHTMSPGVMDRACRW